MFAYANCPLCGKGLLYVDVFKDLNFGVLYCYRSSVMVGCRFMCFVGRIKFYSGLFYYDLDNHKRWWINLGSSPVMFGKVSVGRYPNSTEVGRISIWDSDNAMLSPKAPKFSGTVEIEGKKYHVDIWRSADFPKADASVDVPKAEVPQSKGKAK